MVVAKSLQFGLTEVHALLDSTADIYHLFLLGIHAREWISPATALWTIHAVLGDQRMMEELDWFIHPIVNPDGFTFTHEHVISLSLKIFATLNCRRGCGERPGQITAPSSFVAGWTGIGITATTGTVRTEYCLICSVIVISAEGGSSNDKCFDTYHGPSGFSEPETAAIRDFILSQ